MTIAILGFSCRLPGAANESEFWKLLVEQRCSVTQIGPDRFETARFLHPRMTEKGFAYTFAAGLIDDPVGFDHSVFGISAREVQQIDPQQRILLEVTYEALQNAGLKPSALAGSDTAVFVGASMLDYGNRHTNDSAAIEAHFMTGNSMSILSNRISYAFDLHGPSTTIDTACSSGMVAFDEACSVIRSGRARFAVVAGVNLILSAAPFVGFSRAGMLSPTGRCRSFSAMADGYVRSEGAVSFIIGDLDAARREGLDPRAIVLASGVNSDGRTTGISLPSLQGQRQLLETIYGEGGIDPESLAFVEAHGTGTRAGDPIEAGAIGSVIGRHRSRPLPLGSVKSNIGHLEPASGLAGLMKAVLAIENHLYPASLHLDERNPDIPFEDLGLHPAAEPVDLSAVAGGLAAGISSFGFGGTNAHVAIREPRDDERRRAPASPDAASLGPPVLLLSAATEAALRRVALDSAEALRRDPARAGEVARALVHRRDLMSHRLVVPGASPMAAAERLTAFGADGEAADVVTVSSFRKNATTAFVFVGNGTQHVGMGRAAYEANPHFRARFDEIDGHFHIIAGWSLVAALKAEDFAERLVKTSFAQPMIFAVQSATVAALKAAGLSPDLVLGHSVGEIAAAEACGAIPLQEAVRLIYERSEMQEDVFDEGRMAAVALSEADARAFCEEFGGRLEIAAVNGPSSITLSGSTETLKEAAARAKSRRIAMRVLDIRYPFHSSLLDPYRQTFEAAVGTLHTHDTAIPFISSVTGAEVAGHDLGAGYWWRNVREPVHFRQAVDVAAEKGVRIFVEIGARTILTGPIADTLREAGTDADVLAATVDAKAETIADPVWDLFARALAKGARVDPLLAFGPPPVGRLALPLYPWQHEALWISGTPEAIDTFGTTPMHPLAGGRILGDAHEWRALLDTVIVPYLGDHRVDGEAVVPGAGLAEIAFHVGRSVHGDAPLLIEDFDILQPLVLSDKEMREVRTAYFAGTGAIEIRSRRRLSDDVWTVHARGRIARSGVASETIEPPVESEIIATDRDEIYATATRAGLDYGPHFRLVRAVRRDATRMEIDLDPGQGGDGGFSEPQCLHPAILDAAFHGLFAVYKTPKPGEKKAFLPVRFGRLHLEQSGADIVRARIFVSRDTDDTLICDIVLLDAEGHVVARLDDALFRAVLLSRMDRGNLLFHLAPQRLGAGEAGVPVRRMVEAVFSAETDPADEMLLLDAFAHALAHRSLRALSDGMPFAVEALVEAGRLAPAGGRLAARLAFTLEEAGLARESEGRWTLAADSGLPAPEALLRTLVADYPRAVIETAIAAQILETFDRSLAGGEPVALRPALLDVFETEALAHAGILDGLKTLLADLEARCDGRTLRLLVAEPDGAGIVRALSPFLGEGRAELVVTGTDKARLDLARARADMVPGLSFVPAADLASGHHDLAIGLAGRASLGSRTALWTAMEAALAPGGVFALFHVEPRPFLNLVLWATDATEPSAASLLFPELVVPAAGDSAGILTGLGLSNVETRAGGSAAVVLAERGEDAPVAARADALPVVLIAERSVEVLARAIEAQGRHVEIAVGGEVVPAHVEGPVEAVFVAQVGAGAPRERLRTGMLRLIDIAARLSDGPAGSRLWVLTSEALGQEAGRIDPVGYALRSFARVVANEYSAVELHALDAADGTLDALAEPVADALCRAGAETELLVDADGIGVLRAERGLPPRRHEAAPAEAAKLVFRRKGSFESFQWQPAERPVPGSGEVEIAIGAAGLNFRDVMFALGVLPEEILEGGFAGAVVGFECAGTVTRVGAGVKDVAPGERVMAFAPGAFATHAVLPRAVLVKVPDAIPVEAAATMPVAFLTAWYSLVSKAQIRRGEWVLVHGAAGGVGLAAIQIAKARGARVAATAGSEDKRAFARLAGADRVYDSRSLGFAQAVLRDTGGVDIVLNSLAGEAMEASVRTLKPFGRFVELGKRDFVDNTRLGLRPFRQNLTYFGVDVDQLLAHDAKLAAKVMRDLAARFAAGSLRPLPYRAFEAHEIPAAFRLMQASGHIGKIVVRPPAHMPEREPHARFAAAPEGVHLVVGGLGGFGFETASWLAGRGAKTIVAASRRGIVPPEHTARVEALRQSGMTFVAEAVDVADPASVEALVARVRATHGPIRGLFHTAVVLDDGLLDTLTSERIDTVLAAKVEGVDNLDRALRAEPLDYFVVYSSVSALIGNPGQGSYVAANAYLEAVIRARRAAGLPGLAVGWGRISDVGLLARDAELDAKVSRVLGSAGLKAEEALAILGEIMAQADDLAVDGTVVCAPMHASAAAKAMAITRSPTFAGLYSAEVQAEAVDTLDLRAMIADKSDGEAREIIGALVAEQVARILRTSSAEIDMGRPLSELGLDSLMALELRLQIGNQLGIELPLVAISAGKSLGELSSRLVSALREGEAETTDGLSRSDIEGALARHTGEAISGEKIDALVDMLESANGGAAR